MKYLIFFASIFFFALPSLMVKADAVDIDPRYHYAWSESAGLIDFRGVKVCADHLEGYAKGVKIGLIELGNFKSSENCDSHTYTNSSKDNWGVNRTDGKLTGFAWSRKLNSWINFAPSTADCKNCSLATIDSTTGEFSGHAWSEAIGRIHLGRAYGLRLNTQTERVLVPQTAGTGPGAPWPNQRFKDNSDGTVTDKLTGLVWLKNASCVGGVAWKKKKDKDDVVYKLPMPNLDNCGLDAEAAEKNWRLPTLRELLSLVHYGRRSPASDKTFDKVQSNKYWSDTTKASDAERAWYVNFLDGKVGHDKKTKESKNYVWPVWDGQK